MPVFPTSLLNCYVTVSVRTVGIDADLGKTEVLTPAGTAKVSLTSINSSTGNNDQDLPTWTATLTGTDTLLGTPNVVFTFVSGPCPIPVGTKFYPSGGQSPHGNAYISPFFRFPVTSVAGS